MRGRGLLRAHGTGTEAMEAVTTCLVSGALTALHRLPTPSAARVAEGAHAAVRNILIQVHYSSRHSVAGLLLLLWVLGFEGFEGYLSTATSRGIKANCYTRLCKWLPNRWGFSVIG